MCGAKKCTPAEKCPYVIRRNAWLKRAQLRLTNNAFFSKAPTSLIGPLDGDNTDHRAYLTVFDECHELEMSTIDAAAIDVDLKDLVSNIQNRNKNFGEPVSEIVGTLYELYKKNPFKINETSGAFVVELLKNPKLYQDELSAKVSAGDDSYTVELDYVVDMIQSIERLINSPDEEWIITEYEKLKRIVIKPVYAAGIAQQVLYSKSDRFLHMSATICGAAEYAKAMGIPDGDWVYMESDNPIPLESRITGVIKGLSLSKSFTEWDRYYTLINKLLMKHKEQRGIIHTVSFDLANKIKDNLSEEQQARCIVSGIMSDIFSHMDMYPDGVVISPSIEKGYSFDNELSRFQIVAKVPYGYLGDPHIKLNSDRDPNWYARQTVLRLVQMCGRSIRGVNDYATTYVIDDNVLKLIKFNRHLFPYWFLESIKQLN
jgi:Rad3-related DNA helicase